MMEQMELLVGMLKSFDESRLTPELMGKINLIYTPPEEFDSKIEDIQRNLDKIDEEIVGYQRKFLEAQRDFFADLYAGAIGYLASAEETPLSFEEARELFEGNPEKERNSLEEELLEDLAPQKEILEEIESLSRKREELSKQQVKIIENKGRYGEFRIEIEKALGYIQEKKEEISEIDAKLSNILNEVSHKTIEAYSLFIEIINKIPCKDYSWIEKLGIKNSIKRNKNPPPAYRVVERDKINVSHLKEFIGEEGDGGIKGYFTEDKKDEFMEFLASLRIPKAYRTKFDVDSFVEALYPLVENSKLIRKVKTYLSTLERKEDYTYLVNQKMSNLYKFLESVEV
ncbi:MAG: hypothetical protein J7K73_00665 [Nanoarchaeota archaeon]|nr:hypothetical protein [Nanoarchaeota archaeon]